MVSGDFCHHDWPGSGCPECRKEREMSKIRKEIFFEVEKAKQKFPLWPTDPLHALAIVQEEVGEAFTAANELIYEPHKNVTRGDLHNEMVQAAAMCIRFLEGFDHYQFSRSRQEPQT